MNRVDRLLGYLLIFQNNELVRAQDLAERFEVSERTVYRDVDALCEVGVPLYGTPGEGYRLMDGYYLPPIMFSEEEARALFLSISMLTGLAKEGATNRAAQSALEKVRAVLPEPTLHQVEALQAVIGFRSVARRPLDLDDSTFIRLQEAIHARHVIQIQYHALHSNDVTVRQVEPHQLAYVDNAWILHAYCRLRADQRYFRLDRIDAIVETEETFDPREFEVRRLHGSPTRVVVRFDHAVVRWVREAQNFLFVEELQEDDQGVVMLYNVGSYQQFVGWFLMWTEHAEVLEPVQLREKVREIAQRLVERHHG